MRVIKRDGSYENFKMIKIVSAIMKAGGVNAVNIATKITDYLFDKGVNLINVEEIQDIVEKELMNDGQYDVAREYIRYRKDHENLRENSNLISRAMNLIEGNNEAVGYENSNKNPTRISTQRDLLAGELSKEISKNNIFSEEVMKAHNDGIIHVHDLDYRASPMFNCCLVNLEDMLHNGTVLNGVKIEKPKSFKTACTVTTQILAQITSNQYGGATITLSHLAPFIDISRQRIRKEIRREWEKVGYFIDEEDVKEVAEMRLRKEIKDGVQTLQYQTVTIMGSNGQSVFLSVVLDIFDSRVGRERYDLAMLIEEVLRQRMKGVKNDSGVWVSPAFPKLLYVLDEENVNPDGDYYWLTKLSAECTARRMVPDYISAKISMKLKDGAVVYPMGCRSFLSVEDNWRNGDGSYKLWGRFNQGVTTINLPYIACLSNGNEKEFWNLLDKYLEVCHESLKQGHERLEGTLSNVSPIHWQDGALARLNKGETIDKLLHDNYSTISLGFAGLCECTYRMKGVSHTTKEGSEFATRVMKTLNKKCEEWKEKERIAYGVYGSPIESTTGTFAQALRNKFGIITRVSDKDYITNSYHVHVTEEINAFDKLSFESPFQELATAGAISYIEAPNLRNNIQAILSIINHIYHNILYAEINLKLDNCAECSFEGEAVIVEKPDGKLVFKCPICGNENEDTLSVVRRTTGYLGSQRWSHGRTAEIRDRVLHL